MSKPNWKDAPSWANYLAQDDEGDWYWFENRPEATPFGWSYNPNFPAGRIRKSTEQSDWQDTVETRPY